MLEMFPRKEDILVVMLFSKQKQKLIFIPIYVVCFKDTQKKSI